MKNSPRTKRDNFILIWKVRTPLFIAVYRNKIYFIGFTEVSELLAALVIIFDEPLGGFLNGYKNKKSVFLSLYMENTLFERGKFEIWEIFAKFLVASSLFVLTVSSAGVILNVNGNILIDWSLYEEL